MNTKHYHKLVRDKIPEIIRENGSVPITHHASDEEYWEKLKEKLQEEAGEFLKEENEEELADILEVIEAICLVKKIDKTILEQLRNKKAKERGRFTSRIILEETK